MASGLHLVEKSVYPKQTFNSIANCGNKIGDFYYIVNKNKILQLLKIMHSYKTTLTYEQMILKRLLIN